MNLMRSWVDIEEGKEKKECLLCDDECESISHVLFDCEVCNSILRNDLCKL